MTTDYLYARPSFLHGMARTLDLWGALDPYNWSPTPHTADANALAVDWGVVGQDLADAMDAYFLEVEEDDQRQLTLAFPSND